MNKESKENGWDNFADKIDVEPQGAILYNATILFTVIGLVCVGIFVFTLVNYPTRSMKKTYDKPLKITTPSELTWNTK